jgi:L-methionine (R)-S-oxide reductase
MSETMLGHLRSLPKIEAYKEAVSALCAILKDEPCEIAKMATVCSLLPQAFEHYFWTGFYRVTSSNSVSGDLELVIGPYQGTMGCLRIAFGRGVCGTAAQTGKTQLVLDVHSFEGHIACDSRSQSEIVVPVFDKNNRLIAVFDVDSDRLSAFDETDQLALEDLMKRLFS